MHVRKTIAVTLIGVAAASAGITEPIVGQKGGQRKWSLTLAFGQQVGGPTGALERAMRDGGSSRIGSGKADTTI